METSALVTLRPPKYNNIYSDFAADLTVTFLPRSVFQGLAIGFRVVFFAITAISVGGRAADQLRVLIEQLQESLPASARFVVFTKSSEASSLQSDRVLLSNPSGFNGLLKLGVSLDLRHADRRVSTTGGVVVVTIVLEGLPERRGTVETRHAEAVELHDGFLPHDSQ